MGDWSGGSSCGGRRCRSLTGSYAWRAYRARGGPRERLVADFLVGAHAVERADRPLTRDRGFQRGAFAGLMIVDPTLS